MHADDADCLSCSDCKLEFIEKRWTDLLINWLNKCVHLKDPTNELNPWSLVEVLKKYRLDICPDEIDGTIMCSDIEAFVRYKYPLLRLRYYDIKDVQKKMYLMTSIVLFHCCVSSITGMVDGDICGNLNKSEQEMILKFCEKLMEMEVTCNNIELAVKEAFDSVKQEPRAYRKIDHSQKPSKMKSEPSESEMPLSSFNSMATDAPPTEGMKQKCNALMYKPAESESFEPCSTSDIPLSSLNSMATDAAPTEKMYATLQSLEFESYEQGALPELTSFLAAGKSPTGSIRQKITATFKSVEYESYVPCSSTDRPSHISKALCKSPTDSTKQKINATIKTVEYESFIPCPSPDKSSYNSKTLGRSPTGTKKHGLNAKSEAKDESYDSCSSAETPSYYSKSLDKSPTGSVDQRLDAKSKAKYKSYASYSSRDRSPCNSKAVDKTPTEIRKKKNPKSKAAKYESQTAARPVTTPVISIMTTGKSPTEQKFNSLKFKSSVTVLPSVVTTDASFSEIDYIVNYSSKSDTEENLSYIASSKGKLNVAHYVEIMPTVESGSERRCLSNCACSRCSPNGPCCADPGNSMYDCNADEGTGMDSLSDVYDVQTSAFPVRVPGILKEKNRKYCPWKRFLFGKMCILLTAVVLLLLMIGLLVFILRPGSTPITRLSADDKVEGLANANQEARIFQLNSYTCKQGLCQKVYEPTSEYLYSSLSRCTLLCMGPQLWPHPIGYTYYSKKVVVLATNKLEYKFQSVPSEAVHMYLAEAFKLFLGDLAKLERYTLDARRMNISRDSMIKKMYIQMDVEIDPDPRIRLDTEESYTIKIETITNQVVIKLLSASFCGIRHALETLSQLILLDQTTGNLITLSNIIIKDAPSYKYRGLMIDTGRNYIPVPDIMRTIDAMASVKLNTFHWRISDVTSFPLHLPAVPQLFEYGSYSRELVYSKDDVKAVVRRAGIRGIRVLLEVAAPGPVGRAWSWIPEATCPTKNKNFSCNNVLCLRLGIHETVFDILQIIYSEILEMTKVDDVFHLSDSVFSMVNCFYLKEDREGFLGKALERLKLANKGFLPKLPIIWYTMHLTKDMEARTWDRFGVQLSEWQSNPSDQFLSRFKVIHSSRWDLSCEVKKLRCIKYRTWQDMYSWKSWRNLEVFTIEGGEAILWTDLVDTGNLDYHLWPRAAAVAERLWSDIALNGTVSSQVYVRLDSQRWRMVLKSVQVQPIWPLYCSFSPGVCLEKIKYK